METLWKGCLHARKSCGTLRRRLAVPSLSPELFGDCSFAWEGDEHESIRVEDIPVWGNVVAAVSKDQKARKELMTNNLLSWACRLEMDHPHDYKFVG